MLQQEVEQTSSLQLPSPSSGCRYKADWANINTNTTVLPNNGPAHPFMEALAQTSKRGWQNSNLTTERLMCYISETWNSLRCIPMPVQEGYGLGQMDIWLGWGRSIEAPVSEVTLLWHCGNNFQLTYLHTLVLQSLFGPTYILSPN